MILRQGVIHERNENPSRKFPTGRKGETSRVTRKSGNKHGSAGRRDHIWEVRSKASTPQMTNKPFKALLHREAD